MATICSHKTETGYSSATNHSGSRRAAHIALNIGAIVLYFNPMNPLAPTGQTQMHRVHATHFCASVSYGFSLYIAPAGHSLAHRPHPVHFFLSADGCKGT